MTQAEARRAAILAARRLKKLLKSIETSKRATAKSRQVFKE